jgi:hypothetical protein
MNRGACWRTLSLSAWMALGAGCAGRTLPARDAAGQKAEGVAEEQAPGPVETPGAASQTEGSEGSNVPRDPYRTRRTLGWISLAIGIEAAAIAVTTSFMLLHEKSILDDNCNAQKQCSRAGIDAQEPIRQTVPWNTGSWIVAAAGVGAGTVLLLTSRRESGRSTALAISPSPAGLALGLRSQF